ncbi:hypothetical protein C7H19_19020 [Aphanothece hegewaldii CCALA 016]|uniref:Uncharacterized protein n=1 Tax=Aphanothece hegewaldii CCALA 016 TaxID=2107694 RepID=A0A2T1LTN4_9CHRO|nr:hypothetical protein [Aphanothece hegewaldii]PSF34222.1 hypothetical protein C7H19_19020 [Aphanothece hegewaldii CCALA 016]
MAKLSPETTEIINQLRQQLTDIINDATAAEFTIFERHRKKMGPLPLGLPRLYFLIIPSSQNMC